MTELLEKAFEEAESLSEEEQDAFAAFILNEISSEHRWKEHLENSQYDLESLTEGALEEFTSGESEELDSQ